jgi:hypothetical protein
MAILFVNLNSKLIYENRNDKPWPSPANPLWNITFQTPSVGLTLNKDDDYSSNIYCVAVNMPTAFNFTITDAGLFWSLTVNLFGLGFALSRQATY